MPIYKTLKDTFGFDSFREGQEEAILKLLEKKSVLAIFPTGSGKSLCYQLTALHLDHLTIVVSPLIALMKDQVDFLKSRGIAAARLDSSLSPEEFREIHRDLRSGKLKLLYTAPERLSNERFVQQLHQLPIDLMVIDEAHCISEWGHNFRPDYLKLARLARDLNAGRILALTATATPDVAADISAEFNIADDSVVHTGFYRPNLELRATPCQPSERLKLLCERLSSRPPGSAIVYVTLQKTAEDVAKALEEKGFKAKAYHAGMKNELRDEVQEWFMASSDAIVIATIAFGMGIDKADIRYVYHYNLPKSLENYSQEIGRAGRDGKKSVCEIFAAADDVIVLENFTYGDTPDPQAVAAMVDSIFENEGEFDLSTYELSRKHDLRPLVVNTLLTYLELANTIEATRPFYSQYQFVPLKTSQEILSNFDQERADFLRKMFACAKKAQKWFTIDLAETAERLGTERDRLVRALTHLEEKGDLTLKVAGLRLGYRIESPPKNLSDLKEMLIERFEKREENDLLRVKQILELSQSSDCLVRKLLLHFGEKIKNDCGDCDRCLGEAKPGKLPGSANSTSRFNPEAIHELRREYPEALASPRQIARFLCGLTSPFLTREKLTRHRLFGSLSEVSFQSVKSAAEEMLVKELR
ncbi:MAG TPA: RecQ family ATP-dependent DNA helicase [Opitutales bacterium]|nr:RecQ family ATP-dependent DNA helicase [Opitutales bacterium]